MTDTLPDPPELDPSVLASSAFGRARKGFDPTEVNAALGRAADALRVWELRDRQLRARIGELELRVSESQELDEHRIATVLGEETARIVTAAKDAATEIRSKAEEQAARLLRETEESATSAADALKAEATELRDDAAQVRAEAVEAAERLQAEAHATAEALESDARRRHDELIAEAAEVLELRTREAESVASGLIEAAAAELSAAEVEAAGIRIEAEVAATEARDRAREDGRAMVAEAKALRERMLADLAERRKTARRQIEGARGGRDRIIEVLRAAGAEVLSTIDGLEDIDAEIQRAADAAAILVDDDIDVVVAELEAELGQPAQDLDVPADSDIPIPASPPLGEAVGEAVGEKESETPGAAESETPGAAESALVAPAAEHEGVTTSVAEVELLDTVHTVETVETVDLVETADGVDLVDVIDTIETLEVLDVDGDVLATLVEERTEVEITVLEDNRPAEEGDSAQVIGMFAGSNTPAPTESSDRHPAGRGELEDEDLDLDLDEDDAAEEAASGAGAERQGDQDDAGATVHDLFARIRAEGLDEPEEGDQAEATTAEVGDAGAGGAGETGATEETDADAGAARSDEPLTAAEGAGGTARGPAVVDLTGDDGGAVQRERPTGAVATAEADPLTELLDQRDRVLVPIEKQLSRALRRLASDEQNEVLDHLRRIKRGRPDISVVLPDPEQTLEHFADALSADFDAAVQAGSAFWAEVAGSSSDSLFGEDDRVRAALIENVRGFLSMHRAHLERTFAEADEAGSDLSDLGDRIRAAYRDWRSTSLAELAGDLATAGFTQGERLAAGPGTPWRWVVDNGGLPCADGEDNALAGPVPCEEPFPTGDITPPAHPGCRCILVPAHR